MLNLKKILNFVQLLNKFRRVERILFVNGEDRRENDIEHSYQLAMLALYIIDSQKLNFNSELILKYALVHDLVEVHAGDTYIYSTNVKKINGKEKREKKAMRQLQNEFPEFPELHKTIEDYENKTDEESKFIYALDKIQPILNIYEDGGELGRRKIFHYKCLLITKKIK